MFIQTYLSEVPSSTSEFHGDSAKDFKLMKIEKEERGAYDCDCP